MEARLRRRQLVVLEMADESQAMNFSSGLGIVAMDRHHESTSCQTWQKKEHPVRRCRLRFAEWTKRPMGEVVPC